MGGITIDTWQEFVRKEVATGGPDAHLVLAVEHAKTRPDPAWYICCCIAAYCSSTGAVIDGTWSANEVTIHPDLLPGWLASWWDGVALRKDRRSVMSPGKLAECLTSMAEWRLTELPSLQHADYETVWKSALEIRYVGRYMAIKLLDCLYQVSSLDARMPDIRPDGAWSPRRTLDQLLEGSGHTFPGLDLEHMGNKPSVLAHVQGTAEWARNLAGIPLEMFQLEVLLCNVRQGVKGKYPGRTLDTDLEHHAKVTRRVGEVVEGFDFWGLRRRLFPAECLGEVGGWSGVRRELGQTWELWGYFWCDVEYDFADSVADLSHPIRRV